MTLTQSNQPCLVCGAPATHVVHDHEQLPDSTYWQIEAEAPPWHLCDAHAGGPEHTAEYRQRLLGILAGLDRLTTDANAILANPGDVENGAMAEELRDLLVDMRAQVEEKLERLAHA